MSIDDTLHQHLVRIEEENQRDVGREVVLAAVNSIPFAGGAISSLVSGEASRRNFDRMGEVLREMKRRLEEVEESAVDVDYFRSEEFQTLLLLTVQQIGTTHQREKLSYFAAALANSGLRAFSDEQRKELFLRALSTLLPAQIDLLVNLCTSEPASQFRHPNTGFLNRGGVPLGGELLLLVQHLVALGFVEERLVTRPLNSLEPRYSNTWTQSDAARQLQEFLETPPVRHYRTSPLGMDFLRFMRTGAEPQSNASAST
jgi:hypothetical protein